VVAVVLDEELLE
jgi:hypothetical protein